jgi:hypothetical protein
MVPTEIIVQVGAEGGTLTIEGKHFGDIGWQFRMARNEMTLYDDCVDDDRPVDVTGFIENSDYFDSLGEALQLFDRYPYWIKLYVVEVHPEFVHEVLAEVRSRGGKSAEARWREALDRRRNESQFTAFEGISASASKPSEPGLNVSGGVPNRQSTSTGHGSLDDSMRWMSNSPSTNQELGSGDTPYSIGSCSAPKVRELHIDFLLEEEFNVSPSFLEHFIRAAGKGQGSFTRQSVKRSVEDQFGEADLVVLYGRSQEAASSTAILIEDKIGAGLQPEQAERYRRRGEYGKGHEWWQDYWTCLVAPKTYITEEAADGFDATITLEEIKGWMAVSEPARHSFKARVIHDAILKSARLGPQEVDQQVTDFRARYFGFLQKFFSGLGKGEDVYMRPPTPSWKGETWFRIKSPLLRQGAYIHHKAPNGFVDLTFPYTDADRLRAAEALLEQDMTLAQTGKSAAIRLQVSTITEFADFELERNSVEEAFESVKRLLTFYLREHARLEPILTSAATVPAE